MAMLVDDPDERAAALANEHKCYCQISQFDKAQQVMQEIRSLAIKDKFVRMVIDVGDACMMTFIGLEKQALSLFAKITKEYAHELSNDSRHLYEEIQRRRGFALTRIQKYGEAVPFLNEATSFINAAPEDMRSVYLFLGICHAELAHPDAAETAFLKAIAFGLADETEADAHYRVGILYFMDRAFGQAKHHLEAVLELPQTSVSGQLRKFVYQQLSRTCHTSEKLTRKRGTQG